MQPESVVEPESRGWSKLVVYITSGIAVVVGGVAGWMGAALLMLAIAYSHGALHTRSFDAQAWNDPDWQSSRSQETHFHSIRQQMVDDLLARQLHAGMSQEDVLALLGPKDADPYFREPDPQAWIYCLGIERGIGVDNEWLFVSFDERGHVTRAFLATD